MKTRIFNLIILDESGSMQSIKKEATDRVNRSRERLYCCMAKPDFSAKEANEHFFDEEN